MTRTWLSLGLVVCCQVFGGAHAGCMAQDSPPAASRPTPAELVVLKDAEPVKKRFNVDKAKLRVLALVSPT